MSPKEMSARRAALGLSLAKMASELGIPTSTYANWEKARSKPGPGMGEKLSTVLLRLEGKSFLQVPLDPETYKRLAERARREGKTAEETAGMILQTIFGLLIFGFFTVGLTANALSGADTDIEAGEPRAASARGDHGRGQVEVSGSRRRDHSSVPPTSAHR